MRNAKLLMINTAVLTLSGFLMRTIAVAFNVYLTNRIGSAGIGLFQLIMTVYGLAVTFASAGIKLASTRLVTDSLCSANPRADKIMAACIRYALGVSLFVAGIFYVFSTLIAREWIADERAVDSLKILALSLPPVSVSAAMSGYFTARKTMLKYSFVQLFEQLSKIAVTIGALFLAAGDDIGALCAALAIGTTASEFISCSLSCAFYSFERKIKSGKGSGGKIFPALLRIAIPDAVGSGMRSVLLTVEHLLIPVGFRKSGQSADSALATYGTVHAMALPVVLYPAAVLTALSGMLVPELSRCLALGEQKKINSSAIEILRMTLIYSLGTAAFIFFFADTVSSAVYSQHEAAFYIKLLSLLLPIMYTDTVVDGMLKGLDQQMASMRYNIIDSALCVVLVYFLLPKFAIKGYIFILFLSEIINFSLSINKLAKITELKINIIQDISKPLLAAIGAGSAENLLCFFVLINSATKLSLALLVIIFVPLYFTALFGLGCIDKEKRLSLTNRIAK